MLSPGSYRYGVECGLSRAVAAVSLLFAVSWSMFLVSRAQRLTPGVLVVAVVFVTLVVRVAVRGVLIRLSRIDALAAIAVAIVGHLVVALDGASQIVIGQRCMMTVPAVLLAIGFLPRRTARCAALLSIGAQMATSWPTDGPAGAVEGVWPVVAAAVAGEVFAPLMRASGSRADWSERRARAAKAAAARAEGRRAAHREFQGMLHDEVSTALRAISLPGIAVDRVREAARGAMTAIVHAPVEPEGNELTDLASLVRMVGAPDRTSLTIEVVGTVLVTAEVATAAMGAANEALRNVANHARAQVVRVRLHGHGDSCSQGGKHGLGDSFNLHITDDGVGFATAGVRASSVGLQRSVIRRMSAVGGTAEVLSSPGRGTTVRLTWESPPSEGTEVRLGKAERMRAAVGDVRRPLAAVCLPFLLVMGVIAGIHTSRTPGAGWLMVWYVLLAAITVVLLTRAGTRIGGLTAGAASVFAVAGALGSFFVLPLAGLADYTSWPIGAVTPLLTLLVIVRPSWEALLALALEQAGIIILVVTGPSIASSLGEALVIALPALLAPALGVVTGLVIGRTVSELGGVTMRANVARSAALATESAQRARERLHRRRMADLGEEILPFLRGTASGENSPDDPEVRSTARLLASAVRDEIHIPGVLDRATRDLLSAARATGCVVTIQSDADDPHPPALLRLMLTAALCTGPTPQELVLSVNVATDTAHAALVVLPGDPQRADALREAVAHTTAIVENVAEFTWVEVSVRS